MTDGLNSMAVQPSSKVFEGIIAAKDRDSFSASMQVFALDMGYPWFAVMGVTDKGGRPASFKTIRSMPLSYDEEIFCSPLAALDPVMAHCKRSSTPIAWNRHGYLKAGAAEKWEQMSAHGLRAGVAVALHLPEGKHIALGLDGPDQIVNSPADQELQLSKLMLAAAFAVEPAIQLLTESPAPQEIVKLTQRELECLKWTLEGKSAWEIATIMSLTESWTSKLLQQATRKLGCVNKAQSVAKALRLGLIP
jgi:DNA-binding CsgD family transcriptional regulator